nr:D-arabinono-1,4-lactone oxidase [Micromonospora sp. KC721]
MTNAGASGLGSQTRVAEPDGGRRHGAVPLHLADRRPRRAEGDPNGGGALRPFGARPHWGKATGMSPAEITALTRRATDCAALRGEVDPTGKFGNELVDALFPIA